MTAAAEENVVGTRIVRIFAREDDELAKFSERSTKVFEASVAAARMRAVYIPLIAFLPNLAVAVPPLVRRTPGDRRATSRWARWSPSTAT